MWRPIYFWSWLYPYLIVNHFESGMNSTYAVKPGSYHTTRPRTVRQYHDALRTTYNLRAKEGFQYWLLERPKPTPCKWCMILRECLVWSCLLNAPALFNPKLTAFHIKCKTWEVCELLLHFFWNYLGMVYHCSKFNNRNIENINFTPITPIVSSLEQLGCMLQTFSWNSSKFDLNSRFHLCTKIDLTRSW